MRIRDPKTTALIFASGKMVVTGAKSEDDSRLASRKYARIIQKLGFDAKFAEFKIQNIVGSCDVKFPIRLEGLAFSHGAFSSYEPELFPGLIYRMMKPKVVLLIFVSGKIVLTGAKVREEIYMAFNQIYTVLVGKSASDLGHGRSSEIVVGGGRDRMMYKGRRLTSRIPQRSLIRSIHKGTSLHTYCTPLSRCSSHSPRRITYFLSRIDSMMHVVACEIVGLWDCETVRLCGRSCG